jgi:hypothetical protein
MVGNMNNYVINGIKERIKKFVGAMKPINKIVGLIHYPISLNRESRNS